MQFSGALAISAVTSVPWSSPWATSVALGLCGLFGLGYTARVFVRARRQTAYKPVLEDWLWYVLVLGGLYAALAVAAIVLAAAPQAGLMAIAGAALGLLLVGIHNAWDSVTHIVVNEIDDKKTE